jgi:hypothetical protein
MNVTMAGVTERTEKGVCHHVLPPLFRYFSRLLTGEHNGAAHDVRIHETRRHEDVVTIIGRVGEHLSRQSSRLGTH